MKITNIDELIGTREQGTKEHPNSQYQDYDMDEKIKTIYRYNDLCEIALLEDGNHHLHLENGIFNGALKELEILLWDWYKWQLGLSEEDMHGDLNNRTAEFLDAVNLKVSLDEISDEEVQAMDLADQQRYLYLSNEWSEFQSHDFIEPQPRIVKGKDYLYEEIHQYGTDFDMNLSEYGTTFLGSSFLVLEGDKDAMLSFIYTGYSHTAIYTCIYSHNIKN